MRRIAVTVFLGGGLGFAQSKLPAISPTAAPANSVVTPAASAAAAGAAQTGLPAAAPIRVSYSPGLLEVDANNSGLSDILREIGRQTGMKITGGVADERVYGRYGPAAPAEVLATLLGGTNTNMILRESASNAPKELILTPREGGITPPDLNGPSNKMQALTQQRFAGEDHPDEVGSPRPPYGGGVPGMSMPSGPPDPSAPGPHPTNPNYQPRPGPVRSPLGAQTPQQIYQQLQQMQQTPQP